MTVFHKSFNEGVLLLLQVPSLPRYAPAMVVETPYHTPLHMCWKVRSKVQVPVCVHLSTVYSDVKFTILHIMLPWYQGRGDTHPPPLPW